MHVAVCKLLSYEDYYEFVGRDADGWPHYTPLKTVPAYGPEEQEAFMKRFVIQYFKDLEVENGGFADHQNNKI
jgi:hypothetical protein